VKKGRGTALRLRSGAGTGDAKKGRGTPRRDEGRQEGARDAEEGAGDGPHKVKVRFSRV